MLTQSGVSPAGRVDWVDYVKGITIILVVQMHVTLGIELSLEAKSFMGQLVEFFRPFRIPLFFIVAGLFVDRAMRKSWRVYLDKKLVHFAYFYVLWSLFQVLLKIALSGMGNHPVDWRTLLWLPIEPIGVMWFIYVLSLFFLVTRLLKDMPPLLLYGIAVLLYALPIHTGYEIVDQFAARYVFFLSGYFGARAFFAFARAAEARPLLSLAGAAVFTGINVWALSAGWHGNAAYGFLAAYAGALSVIALAAVAAKRGYLRFLKFVGQNSLQVHVGFFLPAAILRIALVKLGLVPEINLFAILTTVFAVISALIAWWVLKGTPLAFLYDRPEFLRLTRRPQFQAA